MTDRAAREEAIGWLIRLRNPASADWEAFTTWLEQSSANREAYDSVVLADADMAEVALGLETPQAIMESANDNQPGLFHRFGGVAVALLVALLAYPAYQAAFPTYSIETALGEHRTITLDDGTVIDLNGGTRVTFDRRNARLAYLDSGEARFRVVHDPNNPFAVQIGDARVEDIGTVFNISRETNETEVSVAEGLVMFNPAREAVLLKPGQRLRVAGAGAAPIISAIDPTHVGGWTSGRLDYSAAMIADVASDLSRAYGQPVDVDAAIAERKFTGTILVKRNDPNAVEDVAALIGVAAHKTDIGWRLATK